jgi:hypothetical protein
MCLHKPYNEDDFRKFLQKRKWHFKPVFWSGISYGKGGKYNAQMICDKHNARLKCGELPWKTLEMLLAEAGIQMLDYDLLNPEAVKQWDSASLTAAKNAFGEVVIILGIEYRKDNVYVRIECETLRKNQDVSYADVYDPKAPEHIGRYDRENIPRYR